QPWRRVSSHRKGRRPRPRAARDSELLIPSSEGLTPRSSELIGGAMAAVDLFVNGTLMRGLALHGNLDGAEFLGEARTAPIYRLYSIDDRHPGMFEVEQGGVAVAGELYRVPEAVLRRW